MDSPDTTFIHNSRNKKVVESGRRLPKRSVKLKISEFPEKREKDW